MNFNNKEPIQIIEFCENCENKTQKNISSKYIKISKFLVILNENDIDISQINADNLNKFEFQEEEEKKNFELVSIILENKGSYDYYNREQEQNEFTKNEREENKDNKKTVYNFSEMKGNIICLIYREKKNENNNNENESQSSTKAESINNEGNEKQREDNINNQNNNNNNSQQNSNNNNRVKKNNFL